jgi:hypothetical protein
VSYTPPRIVKFQGGLLDNGAYGFPRGALRRRTPWVLMCLHISGNLNTASGTAGVEPGSGTYAEVSYMARNRNWGSANPDYGNSAHDYVARNGEALACITTNYAAWNNGGINTPNTTLASINSIVTAVNGGMNANEAYVREVECTGYSSQYPVTAAQKETVAYLISKDSIEWKIPISRDTVHLHRDLDSVNKPNCPFHTAREEQLAAIIARAQVIKGLLPTGPQVGLFRVEGTAAQVRLVRDSVARITYPLERMEPRMRALGFTYIRVRFLPGTDPIFQGRYWGFARTSIGTLYVREDIPNLAIKILFTHETAHFVDAWVFTDNKRRRIHRY